MTDDDYGGDATELLETYGECLMLLLYFDLLIILVDFLMKYIVIGRRRGLVGIEKRYVRSCSLVRAGEAGTGKSCLLHHFTHNSCMSILPKPLMSKARGNSGLIAQRHSVYISSQRPLSTHYRRRVFKSDGETG
jgi:hypothetical protein